LGHNSDRAPQLRDAHSLGVLAERLAEKVPLNLIGRVSGQVGAMPELGAKRSSRQDVELGAERSSRHLADPR